MKRIDVAAVLADTGSLYPSPFHEPCRTKNRRRRGNEAELTQFGLNLLRLQPRAWSSQRDWHTKEHEFVYVLSGRGGGRHRWRRGSSARWRCRLVQGGRSQRPLPAEPLQPTAQVLEVGTRAADDAWH